MARTVAEIKDSMTTIFVGNDVIKEVYGLEKDRTFDSQFSKASIESIIFYIVAFAIHIFEKILDLHKQEVTEIINELTPHTLKWYANKTRAFRFGQKLLPDSDRYSDEGLTDEQIEAMQIIRFVSIVEGNGALLIKVAKGTDVPEQLEEKEVFALEKYLAKVKDAGVRIQVWSMKPDILTLKLEILYNPMMIDSTGRSHVAGGEPVEDAIRNYIKNLPFNGEYRNAALIDALQEVPGVVIPTLESASASFDNETRDILVKENPYSGYYTFDSKKSVIKYIAYESVLH